VTWKKELKILWEAVKRILNTERDFVFASEASHEYTDKYLLVEQLMNITLSSFMTIIELCGLTS